MGYAFSSKAGHLGILSRIQGQVPSKDTKEHSVAYKAEKSCEGYDFLQTPDRVFLGPFIGTNNALPQIGVQSRENKHAAKPAALTRKL